MQLDADQFAGYLAINGHADSTNRAYRALFLRWTDWTTTHGHDLTPDALTARAFAHQVHGSRSLIAHARAMVGHLCAALGVDDVSAAIPLPRQPRQHKPALSTADTGRLLAAADDAGLAGLAGLVVKVGLYTAARRSEIASAGVAPHRPVRQARHAGADQDA